MPAIAIRHKYHWLFYVSIYVASIGVLFFIAELSDLDSIPHTCVRLALFAIELAFFCLADLYLLHRWLASRAIRWWALYLLLMTSVCLIYVVQMYSIWVSNNFISVVAFQNARYMDLTMSSLAIGSILAGLAWVSIMGVCAWRDAPLPRGTAKSKSTGWMGSKWGITTFVVAIALYAGLISQQHRRASLEPGFRETPVASFFANAWTAKMGQPLRSELPAIQSYAACFTDRGAGGVPGYPFQKGMVYRDATSFARTPGATRTPNVILFFTEGESSRLIGAYGGQYKDLTPNIDRLAQRSMRVVDYYNHTAATYQGIIGQLSSGFTNSGGDDWGTGNNSAKLLQIKRQTLATILNGKGYSTYFFTSHHAGAFTNMVGSTGFEHVYDFDAIFSLLHGDVKTQPRTDQLDDNSLFRGLTSFLKQRASTNDTKPFFIATYNIGTHAFIPVAANGVQYGEGESQPLNRLHNYDADLGKFLDWFYASPYADNTIIVFTTDHATYPDRPYRAVAGSGLKPYFVDKIPLLIGDPTHDLPHVLDATGRNSLDLAPTILQLLDIQREPNSFLGHSLFEPRVLPLGITAIGSAFYITTKNDLYPLADVPDSLKSASECEKNIVQSYYAAEQRNRLFDPPPGWSLPQHKLAGMSNYCALDLINGTVTNAAVADKLKIGTHATFAGWFVAYDKQPVKTFKVRLEGTHDFDFSAADTVHRKDVAGLFRGSGSDTYGFNTGSDFSGASPGAYMISLVSPNGQVCPTNRRVVLTR